MDFAVYENVRAPGVELVFEECMGGTDRATFNELISQLSYVSLFVDVASRKLCESRIPNVFVHSKASEYVQEGVVVSLAQIGAVARA